MKKGLLLIAIVVVLVGAYFAIFSKKEGKDAAAQPQDEKQPRLIISQNPTAFNNAFTTMLNSYYVVKNALINWDSATAGSEAKTLSQLASALPLTLLKADSNLILTARNFAGALQTESNKLANDKTIDDQRHAFSTVTDNLYSLINTVRYDKEVVFYDKCPMAFNGSDEAYWLSRDSAITNPYLGNKHPKYKGAMVTCGDVEQRVDYAKK